MKNYVNEVSFIIGLTDNQERKTLMKKSIWKKVTLFILIFTLVMTPSITVEAKETDEYLDELETLKNLIMDSYYGGEVTEEELFEAALDGMTSILDDYSVFYNDNEASSFLNALSSEYVGIGVRLEVINERPVVTEVFEGGAALDAGVRVNDIITKVNDQDTKGLELDLLVDKILGQEGSYVTIEFQRGGEYLSFELERRTVIVPSVTKLDLSDAQYGLNALQEKSVYGVSVSSFMSQTDVEFFAEVEKAKALGAQYFIIDLRDNRGGYLDSCVDMLKKVVPQGDIVTLLDKNNTGSRYVSELKEVPFQVLVLVNENSASASEIFAAAVKDNGDGIVIGERTYGKGVAQSIYRLGDEYLVKLTTQEFFSPNLNKINGVGVEPDLLVDNPEYVFSDKRFSNFDTDEQVVNIEGMLKFLGFFDGQPDESYTTETLNGVKAFQAATGLYPYGVCDFTTQAKLNEEYRKAFLANDVQMQAAIDWILEDMIKEK